MPRVQESSLDNWDSSKDTSYILRVMEATLATLTRCCYWKLDVDHVKKALLKLLERFPLLRMRVAVDRFNQPWFEEIENPCESLDFRYMNQVDAEQWLHAFQEQINGAALNSEQGPLWRVALLREASEDTEQGILYKNTLIFTFHHVICDIISILELENKLVEVLGLLHNGEAIEMKSLPFRVPIESVMAHNLSSPGIWNRFMVASTLAWDKLRVLFCKGKPKNLYLLKFPPPRNHPAPQKTHAVPRNLTREETMALIRCSKANNCTVHGALTASIYFALSQILEQNVNDSKIPLSSTFTINIRQECKPRIENEEFGLYFTFDSLQMTVNSSTMASENFWQFARSCTGEVRSHIDSGRHRDILTFMQCVNVPSLWDLWCYETRHGLRKELFNLTNAGRFSIDQEGKSPYKFAGSYLATQTAQVCYIFGINIFTVNSHLYWTVEYSPEIIARSQAEDFVDLCLRILKDACAL